MSPIRVLLVDDHPLVRNSFQRTLESHGNIIVVGQSTDAEEAIAAAQRLEPDVVLMDIGLPGRNGIEAAREIRRVLPDIRILMLSMYAESQYVEQSKAVGACGYLVKDVDDDEVIAGVLTVFQGEPLFRRVPDGDILSCPPPPTSLSARERDVLGCLAAGAGNRQISEWLAISLPTVEEHRRKLHEKLDLHSLNDLIRYALRQGVGWRSPRPSPKELS